MQSYDDWLESQWEAQFAPDAWEHDGPDWTEVCDYLSMQDDTIIAGLVRDQIEGDGDEMVRLYRAGLLIEYIKPEEAGRMKDPDEEWEVIDRVFDREWQNDALMVHIWEHDDKTVETICKALKDKADRDCDDTIREWYNDKRRS